MTEQENLEAKYGRKKSIDNQATNENQVSQKQDIPNTNETNNERKSIFSKRTKEEYTPRQKDIRENIKKVVNQYNNTHEEMKKFASTRRINSSKEGCLAKIIKTILMVCIITIASCIIISMIAKPVINAEADAIVTQIRKAEDLYYAKTNKFHYFSRTEYDNTLSVDLSTCKYFFSYEVVPDEETGNYKITLYGSTNTFAMAYYHVKAILKEKGILE